MSESESAGGGATPSAPEDRRSRSDAVLTVPQVSEWLAISRGQVFNLIREGELRSFTIGRSRRITAAAVRTYLDKVQGVA